MARARQTGSPPRWDYTPAWDPARNGVHRLIQFIDVLAIAFNQFRQLSFKLPQPSHPGYSPEVERAAQEHLRNEFSAVTRAVFPAVDMGPQHTAAILADAAVAELARMGSPDERAVGDAAIWAAQVGWTAPHVYPRDVASPLHDVFNKEGMLLERYSAVRRGLLAALARAGHPIPEDINRRQRLAFNSLTGEGEEPVPLARLLEWVRATNLPTDGPRPEPDPPASASLWPPPSAGTCPKCGGERWPEEAGGYCPRCDLEEVPSPYDEPEAALRQWASIKTVRGKFRPEWTNWRAACERGGMASGEPNHWLPIIADYWSRVESKPLTEANVVAYLYRTRGLSPGRAGAISLRAFAAALREDAEPKMATDQDPPGDPRPTATALGVGVPPLAAREPARPEPCGSTPPKAFISYSWDDQAHKAWVAGLARRLRADGVDAKIDQYEVAPGDRLPLFMEEAVRENDFVLLICTPSFKVRADGRKGGVGYEGDIMVAEVWAKGNHRKYIPVLRRGSWDTAAPSWLGGKYGINLSAEPYSEDEYHDLLITLHNVRPSAPPLGAPPPSIRAKAGVIPAPEKGASPTFEPIKIEGVVVDEVDTPRNDGTRGSALYSVPFKLSRRPPLEWADLFVRTWDRPPTHTTKHRPGIAEVRGDRVILTRTRVEEIREVHRDTLKLVVDTVNREYADWLKRREGAERSARDEAAGHQENVRRVARDISFD